MSQKTAVAQQQEYYSQNAGTYDSLHMLETEHEYGLAQLLGIMSYYRLDSLLDVGAGTGRVMRHVSEKLPNTKIMGIEPVEGLRNEAIAKGVPAEQIISGDALSLPFEDNSWDIVSAFGILHHIAEPEVAISEMCRVAKHGIFFSDLNNFGCVTGAQQFFSLALWKMGLWKRFQWLKNGRKLEKFSEGDGIHYSYSIFDNLADIRKKFPKTFIGNTKGSGNNLFLECSHISVFAVKSDEALQKLNPFQGND